MEGEFKMFSDCIKRISGMGIRVLMWILYICTQFKVFVVTLN